VATSPLDALLTALGISEREIERRGGPAPKTLRSWRRGRAMPRRDALERLANVLGLAPDAAAGLVIATVAQARVGRAATSP